MGRVESGLAGLKFYDSNPTWPAIKKIFVTQPNPPSLKNRPNPTGWVGSGRFLRIGRLVAHPYFSLWGFNNFNNPVAFSFTVSSLPTYKRTKSFWKAPAWNALTKTQSPSSSSLLAFFHNFHRVHTANSIAISDILNIFLTKRGIVRAFLHAKMELHLGWGPWPPPPQTPFWKIN